MLRRTFLCLSVATLARPAVAQQREFVFAITEGVTYQATPQDIRNRFAPVRDAIEKATGRRVKALVVPSYDEVRAGLARQDYDLAFIHPAQIALAEIRAGRYRAVAWTAGYTEYTVAFLMGKDGAWTSVADLKGHTVVTPDPDSITAAMVRAMFRSENLPVSSGREAAPGAIRVITTRYQDAVPYYLDHHFADVGATAANAVVRGWTDKGGKVLARSRAVPIKQFIVSTRLAADDAARIRQALLGLRDARGGREALDTVGYKGFVAPDPAVERDAMAWLGL